MLTIACLAAALNTIAAGDEPGSVNTVNAPTLYSPIRTGLSRFDWEWLEARYDRDGNAG